MNRSTETLAEIAERFWKKVHKIPDGCWEWTASVNEKGYGKFWILGYSPLYAHRVSIALTGAAIPEGMMVHHTCHNRRCVRPEHLIVATYEYNNRETIEHEYRDPRQLTLG